MKVDRCGKSTAFRTCVSMPSSQPRSAWSFILSLLLRHELVPRTRPMLILYSGLHCSGQWRRFRSLSGGLTSCVYTRASEQCGNKCVGLYRLIEGNILQQIRTDVFASDMRSEKKNMCEPINRIISININLFNVNSIPFSTINCTKHTHYYLPFS